MKNPHKLSFRSAGTVSPETTGFPFYRLLRLAGITVEVFLPANTLHKADYFSMISDIPSETCIIHFLFQLSEVVQLKDYMALNKNNYRIIVNY
jgi:hypothetical protein